MGIPLVELCAGGGPAFSQLSQSQWDSSSSCQYQTHPVSEQRQGERDVREGGMDVRERGREEGGRDVRKGGMDVRERGREGGREVEGHPCYLGGEKGLHCIPSLSDAERKQTHLKVLLLWDGECFPQSLWAGNMILQNAQCGSTHFNKCNVNYNHL